VIDKRCWPALDNAISLEGLECIDNLDTAIKRLLVFSERVPVVPPSVVVFIQSTLVSCGKWHTAATL
jgi:hypothetical protein